MVLIMGDSSRIDDPMSLMLELNSIIRGPCDDYPVTDRSVDVQIVGLRKKLASAGKYIETVRGVGYRFRDA